MQGFNDLLVGLASVGNSQALEVIMELA